MANWMTAAEISARCVVGKNKLLAYAERGDLPLMRRPDGATLFDEQRRRPLLPRPGTHPPSPPSRRTCGGSRSSASRASAHRRAPPRPSKTAPSTPRSPRAWASGAGHLSASPRGPPRSSAARGRADVFLPGRRRAGAPPRCRVQSPPGRSSCAPVSSIAAVASLLVAFACSSAPGSSVVASSRASLASPASGGGTAARRRRCAPADHRGRRHRRGPVEPRSLPRLLRGAVAAPEDTRPRKARRV